MKVALSKVILPACVAATALVCAGNASALRFGLSLNNFQETLNLTFATTQVDTFDYQVTSVSGGGIIDGTSVIALATPNPIGGSFQNEPPNTILYGPFVYPYPYPQAPGNPLISGGGVTVDFDTTGGSYYDTLNFFNFFERGSVIVEDYNTCPGYGFGCLNQTDSDFHVVEVIAGPEPATWGLMFLGATALGAALRRRRRITA